MRVELHIDRLVLEGVADTDAATVAAAVRERLAALLGAGPVSWADRGRVDAGAFTPGGSAAETGARIAAAVHTGLVRKGSA
jgi:hypothetical protein